MRIPSSASFFLAGVLAVIVTGFWLISDHPEAPQASNPSASSGLELGSVIASNPFQPMAMAMPVPVIPEDLPPPKPRVVHSPEAVKDMEDIQFMLRDYRARLGDNPTGTNAEIMKEMMGGNRVQTTFGPPQGQTVNDQGELLDRWGSAYFFHQLSRNEMEIRSSGPDRAMWTNDDIILK